MPEVKVTIHDIKSLTTSTRVNIDKDGVREQITKISFEAEVPPTETARILYMQRQGQTLDCEIKSPQAMMDLHFQPVNLETGEVPLETT